MPTSSSVTLDYLSALSPPDPADRLAPQGPPPAATGQMEPPLSHSNELHNQDHTQNIDCTKTGRSPSTRQDLHDSFGGSSGVDDGGRWDLREEAKRTGPIPLTTAAMADAETRQRLLRTVKKEVGVYC
ncbi:hypothetical protein DPEC_G00123330 [Dallia pectoralis]|uniref:Uncharacterized protein n=1 Tax=Dallia pectoralis TaxID=75939 RepID=A0ACC2GR87_DALPE|nr:hypothetical protein DPEC_G00123330 [Dallia pectoralis]